MIKKRNEYLNTYFVLGRVNINFLKFLFKYLNVLCLIIKISKVSKEYIFNFNFNTLYPYDMYVHLSV